jgi:hypothetical protein
VRVVCVGRFGDVVMTELIANVQTITPGVLRVVVECAVVAAIAAGIDWRLRHG